MHKKIFICPILEYVDVSRFLQEDHIDLVSVGGESYEGARVCDFEWVRKIKRDCEDNSTRFIFHQTGARLFVHGKLYQIPRDKEFEQAKKAAKWM